MNTKRRAKARIIAFISLGCAKNLVNTEQMMYLVREAGYEVTGRTDDADVVVVNTCAFIESAKMEAIETILEMAKAKRAGMVKKIIVAGCLPERYRNEFMGELPEVSAVIGVGSFDDIVSALEQVQEDKKGIVLFGDKDAPVSETNRIVTTSDTWAYLKVADGCDNRCAYCVIPDIRGCYRSRPIGNIINEAQELAQRGTRELILVAQDLTRYGLDLYGKRSLSRLLKELNAITTLKWIRLLYLYPSDIDDELIDVIAESEKIVKYLDIPIQHINDGILKKMNRRGSGTEIRVLFKHLRERIPGLVLRTSIITGLPGEGEEEFTELCDFLREAKIERAGVFPYSPEDGTAAALMEIPDTEVAERRAERVTEIQSHIMDEFNQSRVGSVTTVLVEGSVNGVYYGRSYTESPDVDGYVTIYGEGLSDNSFVDVRITGSENGELAGEVI